MAALLQEVDAGTILESVAKWPSIDLVIPIWNEEESLEHLLRRLATTFAPEARRQHKIGDVRYLIVDDGSTDRSAELISERIRSGLPAVLLRLSRNFGHQCAVSAGIDYSSADYVAVLDADLQDPPELIPAMLEKAQAGFDVVYARRRRRNEPFLRVAGYWLFYRIVSALSEVPVPVDTGDFCLMTRRAVAAMRALPERLRFPRVLRAWIGFRQTGLDFDRPARSAGRSKYTLSRLYRLATDGVVSASIRPLQITQVVSVTYLVIITLLTAWYLTKPQAFLERSAITLVVALCFLVLAGNTVQALCMYILGAYVGRTYLEAKGRPPYLVMEIVGSVNVRETDQPEPKALPE